MVLLLKPLKNAMKPLDVLPYGFPTRRVFFVECSDPSLLRQYDTFTYKVVLPLKPLKNR